MIRAILTAAAAQSQHLHGDGDKYDAPPGKKWVCQVCGKTAENRAAMKGERSRGWDASCFLNAVLMENSHE